MTRLAGPGSATGRYVPPARAVEDAQDPEERLRIVHEAAREQGLAEGLEEGRRRARAEAEERLTNLSVSIEDLSGLRSRLIRAAERDLLTLSVRIAEAIVRERIAEDGETVVRALRSALEEVPKGEAFTVRCHPADEEVLSRQLASAGSATTPGMLRADPSISPGGLVVESAAGEIDVRVETQLRVLERELLSRS